ncbi:putative protein kinase protein [Rosellinia necatrix]|uniref:Uncharacterized protein n=1 Tax=Rosellinia necatrix TaxID=77044 RepID=A0A1S8A6B3_ROSNE|nr:putative protein kinase protein [Rosellinia necatrix]
MFVTIQRTAWGVGLAHEVGALVIAHEVTVVVAPAGGHGGGALEGDAAGDGVGDVGGRGGAQGLAGGALDGGQGRAAPVAVPRRQRRVVGALVVVRRRARHHVVQRVDHVRPRPVRPAQVRRPVRRHRLALYLV